MLKLIVITCLFSFATLAAESEDVCQKNKAQLEKKAVSEFLSSVKVTAVQEITKHYAKNNLTPVKHIDVVSQTLDQIQLKVQAGADSVGLTVKLKEKIKVAIWPEDETKREVDSLGRPKVAGKKCSAHAYMFATTKEKIFLDIINTQTKAAVTSFSMKNLVIYEQRF